MTTQTFKELIVWQKAHLFVLEVYTYTKFFVKKDIYYLTSQFKRAAISNAANITQGYKKNGKADKARFRIIAQGSLEKCKYYLTLSKKLCYRKNNSLVAQINEVSEIF